MAASAIWAPRRTSFWPFWLAPSSMCGRFCRCAPPDMATRRMRGRLHSLEIHRSSAWSFSPTGTGLKARELPGWRAAPEWSTLMRLSGGNCRCSKRPREIFSIAGRSRRNLKTIGQILKISASMRRHGSTTMRYTPYCAARTKPARGPSGRSRYGGAIRKRWRRLKRRTGVRWLSSECCNSLSRGNGSYCKTQLRRMESESLATWRSLSTWTRPTCGFIRESSSWTTS